MARNRSGFSENYPVKIIFSVPIILGDIYFVRLWDSDNLIKAILNNYEILSDSLQAELPLKRIWALVLEEEHDVLAIS